MVSFIDSVKIFVQGGKGGNGSASIKREKYKPLAGPDGGDGGDGGSVIIKASSNTTSLLSFHFSPHYTAHSGKMGRGSYKNGASGEDIILNVPLGTIVKDAQTGDVYADMVSEGQQFIAAQGGKGGLGNAALVSRRRKAPGFALLGEEGDYAELELELKLIADVALVGFPSAGKSSLISTLSAAKPKIADYPFTTLKPNLGIVQAGNTRYTMADVPGLIKGASQGKGLGLAFLRHIERSLIILHVVDLATLEPDRDPVSDLQAIQNELKEYDRLMETDLSMRPQLIALNKIDVPDARDLYEIVLPDLERFGMQIFPISVITHEGLKPLNYKLASMVAQLRDDAETVPVVHTIDSLLIRRKLSDEVSVKKVEGETENEKDYYFEVRGDKPERWIKQTDWNNQEAVGFLADRFANFGLEDKLFEAGAIAGDEIRIGPPCNPTIFDWIPTQYAAAEILSPRGTDIRLNETVRKIRRER